MGSASRWSSCAKAGAKDAQRHFESANRVLQAYDDIQDKTLRALGQF